MGTPSKEIRADLASASRSGCCREVAVANTHLASLKSRLISDFF
jgi:hypothetical protein